ncbi:MAG: ISAs1 family transposase, partial [Caldilineaceae bacterium SB0666_bin_21]|nr:ISAs1 family transposase [Caldilineaceae bacterium SB0666_bin_21]
RIETRRCWTTGDPAYLAHVDPDRDWCDLVSLVWVECERRCGDRVATDTRCFISSLPPRAQPLLQAVRGHWSIENAHHWVLDVAFGEDDSRIRTGYAAHNMAILKRIAHNLLRQDRSLKVGIANKRLAAAWNKDYLCRLIGLKTKPV